MNFKIHCGTKEIGGSCVEVWTESTRILLDFGMPLVEKDGTSFDFAKYKTLTVDELIAKGVLPDIKGLYDGANGFIDGVVISHPHQDHYGLSNYINKNVRQFLGEATHKIIEISNLFMPQQVTITNATYFEKEKAFSIGDITVTPYWADHSAFDSYSFLVVANGKSIFYSGDFRNHGRKANAFKWFTHNAPQNVDYLLLEGTTIGRETKPFKSETEIEAELTEVFKQPGKINLVYTSGQNIDRLVSIYKACLKTNKKLIVDVYVATILKELSKFAKIPFPSDGFRNVKVIFSYYTSRRLKNGGNEQVLYQLKRFKITKEEIGDDAANIVMIVRPSMQKDLEHITGIEGGNLIYSMWEGYLQKTDTIKFINYLTARKFTKYKIHTSGHADTDSLKQMVDAIKPKNIVPIHTFNGSQYHTIFSLPIVELKDNETQHIL
jgi:ribonuclease J